MIQIQKFWAIVILFSSLLIIGSKGFNWKLESFLPKQSVKKGGNSNVSKKILNELLEIIPSTKYGTIPTSNTDIINNIEKIISLKDPDSSIKLLNGQWKLLWTTEKEILFFIKNGLFFLPNSKYEQIIQTIRPADGQLINRIEFQNQNYFQVNGRLLSPRPDASALPVKQQEKDDISTKGERNRIYFEFQDATIRYNSFEVKLPPVGKGWFDNVYVDQQYRIVKDIRGDYLISQRI